LVSILVNCANIIFSAPTQTSDAITFRDDDGSNEILEADDPTNAEDLQVAASIRNDDDTLFQGDIQLLPDQLALLNKSDADAIDDRTGILSLKYRWPKNRSGQVVVPFLFDWITNYSTAEKDVIRRGMNDIEKYTCIRFIERSIENDFLRIFSDNGCYSALGRRGGMQPISLSKKGCIYKRTVTHELVSN